MRGITTRWIKDGIGRRYILRKIQRKTKNKTKKYGNANKRKSNYWKLMAMWKRLVFIAKQNKKNKLFRTKAENVKGAKNIDWKSPKLIFSDMWPNREQFFSREEKKNASLVFKCLLPRTQNFHNPILLPVRIMNNILANNWTIEQQQVQAKYHYTHCQRNKRKHPIERNNTHSNQWLELNSNWYQNVSKRTHCQNQGTGLAALYSHAAKNVFANNHFFLANRRRQHWQ